MLATKWILFMVYALLTATTAFSLEEANEGSTNGTNASHLDSNPDDPDPDPDAKLPSEVQKAVCTVTAGEVKASAEAVTTKTLKGVCGSDEMNLAFRQLEAKLYEELRLIKLMLEQLTQVKVNETFKKFDTSKIESTTTTTTPTITNIPKFSQNELIPKDQLGLKKIPKLKLLQMEHKQMPQSAGGGARGGGERQQEVDKFNNTMLADQDVKLFTYYWKLENFTQRIANLTTTTINSPIFSIRGKSLQLKCTFHHLNREMMNLQLGYAFSTPEQGVGHHNNNNNNIMLDMGLGGFFKQLKWTDQATLKHKISILDQYQSHQHRSQDLSSQELTKLDMGFSIPHSALLGSTYIKSNSLLIQILLYL
ncbi:uncharacterized protein Dwil_GK16957 [Drosophila willistoni]|uniref:Uncharacterized protein n=2 Tax=Drosophila willistoni TaxID=7260 RepID=B4MLJ8_DROWI|nr:uncharacterized protein Dwil_GK16957 [Drosophila willistoni]